MSDRPPQPWLTSAVAAGQEAFFQANGQENSDRHREPAYRFEPIDSASFATSDYRPEWLVRRLLVKGQPCVVGGSKKVLKTSLLVDLATGTPFLGEFQVQQPMRVAFLSGESGPHTLQETARRVCQAKAIDLTAVDCLWDFRLPQLARPGHLAELQAGLRDNGVAVVVVDPLYLCLLAGQGHHGLHAANLFDMGPLLLSVSQACLSVGCTPCFGTPRAEEPRQLA